jgi:uncharacterized protein YjdB
MTLAKGTSLQMFAIVQTEDATHYGVTWSSDNPAVVSVNAATGQISANANGTATITAAIPKTTKKATCVVAVMTPAQSVQITPNTLTLTVSSPTSSTGTLTTKVKPADACQKVTWYSANTAIAKVNGSGLVTAVSEGTVWIYAEATDGSGVRGSCVVTVKPPVLVNSVQLPDPIVVFSDGNGATSKDRTKTVACTIKPSTATDKTFNFSLDSSNKATAELTNDGQIEVVGMQSGAAKLTVKSNDGAAAWTSDVIVVDRQSPAYSMYLAQRTAALYKNLGKNTTLTLKYVDQVEILGTVGNWYYVQKGNTRGFISKNVELSTEKPPTLQDYITVIDDSTCPIHISIVNNSVTITAYLAISGDLADVKFPDTSKKYREYIVDGIKENWKASSLNVFEFEITVTINVIDINDGKLRSISSAQSAVPVYAYNKLGVSEMKGSNSWSVANPGYFYIYLGDSRSDTPSPYTLAHFKSVAAHEFGHILGMDDLYLKSNSIKEKYCYDGNWSLMCHQYVAAHINNFDMQMVLTAFSKNKFQSWK